MLDRKLPLNSLRAFEVAARRGSLTAAAGELQVSIAAVSRHIAQLESYLAYTLLVRGRAGVEPTERGKAFFTAIAEAFERIEKAARVPANSSQGFQGTLDVALYSTFATEWLAPRLDRFRERFPDIELSLRISTGEADFDCDRVDVAVTARSQDDRQLRYDTIFDALMVPVCSPELAFHEGWTCPQDMALATVLYERREGIFWRLWWESRGVNPETVHQQMRFDCTALAYQVARKRGGVALGQLFYLANELAAGDLVMPFPVAIRAPFTHSLVCKKSRADEPLIAGFRRWVLEEAAQTLAMIASLDIEISDKSTQFPAEGQSVEMRRSSSPGKLRPGLYTPGIP